ncbi:MAG: T9SS type A sorting domain-containing protein [Ferruginibacter sp.]
MVPSLDVEPVTFLGDSQVVGSRVYYTYELTNINSDTSTWIANTSNPIATFKFSVDPTTLNMRLEDLSAENGGLNESAYWYVQIDSDTGDITNYTTKFYGTGAVNSITGDSYVPLQTIDPLPVQFINFTAVAQNSNALLNWTVANESEISDYYEVDRSLDGNTFNSIATLPITNPNAISNNYSYTDHNITSLTTYDGVISYRIKQVDKDGNWVYSQTQNVTVESKVPSINIYPNPVTNIATITFGTDDAEIIDVIDLNGRVLKTYQFQKGSYQQNLSLGSLTPGNYLLKVSNGKAVKTLQIVKVY